MTEHRRPRRRPCLRCDVCLKLRLPLTRPEAVGCVPSKRSIICLLCAPRCSLLCFATFSRGTQRIKIRTLCTGIRIRSSSIRVQLRVAAAAASSASGRPPWSFSPPPSRFNGSYFVIIYVALGVVADVSGPLTLALASFCAANSRGSTRKQRHRSQDTFLAVVDLLANLLKIFWLLHFITPDPSEDTRKGRPGEGCPTSCLQCETESASCVGEVVLESSIYLCIYQYIKS